MKRKFLIVCSMLFCHLATAAIPSAPSEDLANGSQDWLDVGANILKTKIGPTVIVGTGLVVLCGVASVVFRSYQRAQEKEDLGIFFKSAFAGLIAATFGIALIYVGNQYITA